MTKLPGIGLIFVIGSLFVSSWILIHFLAIFGVFLALAYPLWWLFFPRRTVCFFCRSRKERENCPLCRREIEKGRGVHPKSLSSAIFNGILILLFSVVSIGVVLGESRVFFGWGFFSAPKTASFVIPEKGQHRLGEIFPMKIEISGIKTPVNTVQADLGFDSTKLEVADISTSDSFASIFVQKEINNEGGYARISGGLPNPGFSSDNGVFATVFLRGKSPGIVRMNYLPSSMVLANDGKGTNILKDLSSISYLILPERISEDEEEMQKNISLNSDVLGETTGETQMKFYEENNVLGESIKKEIKRDQKPDPAGLILGILERIDTFALSLWQGVLNIF